jgi:hypothetical protein
MTVKEHLHGVHQHLSDLHKDLSERHAAESSRYESAGMKGESSHHSEMSRLYAKSADFHKACADKCAEAVKSERAAFEKRLVPDGITSVATSDNPIGIRAIPRPGAPATPATLDKANVPPQFAHLLSNLEEG